MLAMKNDVLQQIEWARQALTCAESCLQAHPDIPTCQDNLKAAVKELDAAIQRIEQFWKEFRAQ